MGLPKKHKGKEKRKERLERGYGWGLGSPIRQVKQAPSWLQQTTPLHCMLFLIWSFGVLVRTWKILSSGVKSRVETNFGNWENGGEEQMGREVFNLFILRYLIFFNNIL